jgi:hypothetical protein
VQVFKPGPPSDPIGGAPKESPQVNVRAIVLIVAAALLLIAVFANRFL